ncbi:MAG: zf-HC2 domain-containing protein [Gemmatimonadaceae bacterium]|nr:zf-HC2 domain-containing protein [Gemmatimonadaceae bacterium]
MDCKQFRKQHLAYLDDTLPGEVMAAAQRHVMQCDGCAAHDTLVRRSLMVARSLPTLEPSADFQQKLRARLAECRTECRQEREAYRLDHAPHLERRAGGFAPGRSSRMVVAVAASAVLGILAYQAVQVATATPRSMQPVIAASPTPVQPSPYLTPQMVQAMSTGNPMWPAAMMVDDAPMQAMSAGFSLVSAH